MWLVESLQDNYEVPVALVFGVLFIWLYKRILRHDDDATEKPILARHHGNNNIPVTEKQQGKSEKKVHFNDEKKPQAKSDVDGVQKKPVDRAALHSAVKSGDLEKVRELLQQGADPTIPDRDNNNSLHIIFKDISTMPLEDAENIFQLLLSSITKDKASAVNMLNIDKNTPLHLAVSNTTPSLVRMLLDRGADRYIQGKDGNTPLHTIIDYMQFSQVPAEMDIFNLLLTHNPPEVVNQNGGINCVNDDQLTALHLAVTYEEAVNVKMLLDAGADPNIADSDGNTVLHTFVMNLDQRQDLTSQDRDVLTALLEAKADVVRKNKEDKSVLCLVNNPDIEEEILNT